MRVQVDRGEPIAPRQAQARARTAARARRGAAVSGGRRNRFGPSQHAGAIAGRQRVDDPPEGARVDRFEQAAERAARPVGRAAVEVVHRRAPEVVAVDVDDARSARDRRRRREGQRGRVQRIVDDEARARGEPRQPADVARQAARRSQVRGQVALGAAREQAMAIVEQQREAAREQRRRRSQPGQERLPGRARSSTTSIVQARVRRAAAAAGVPASGGRARRLPRGKGRDLRAHP